MQPRLALSLPLAIIMAIVLGLLLYVGQVTQARLRLAEEALNASQENCATNLAKATALIDALTQALAQSRREEQESQKTPL